MSFKGLINTDCCLTFFEQVLKIAILAEKYATDYSWYVDIILELIKVGGDFVGEEVGRNPFDNWTIDVSEFLLVSKIVRQKLSCIWEIFIWNST